MRGVRGAVVLAALLVACGGERESAKADSAVAPEVAGAKKPERSTESFMGVVEPRSATQLRAPRNYFRVGSWQSDSGWIKLEHLHADGAEVKKGDMVARFEFSGERARDFVQSQISNARASAARQEVRLDSELGRLKTSVNRLDLDAERARLDTLKGGVVSSRDLERFELDHDLAVFDAGAERERLGATRRETRATTEYHERDVARANALQTRFDVYKERFAVRAPHDGVFRHGFYKRRRRKVQKGDGMRSGMEFASIAKSADIEVRFFVPEHRFALLERQKKFAIKHPTDDRRYDVTVETVDSFPQELGFLLGDNELPNAREKMFVVSASFDAPPEGLSAGLEVKVVER